MNINIVTMWPVKIMSNEKCKSLPAKFLELYACYKVRNQGKLSNRLFRNTYTCSKTQKGVNKNEEIINMKSR